MALFEAGQMVAQEWLRTSGARPDVKLDQFVVMPNHFHGIIWLTAAQVGTARRAPTLEHFGKPVARSLPTVIRAFKSAVTKRINTLRNTPEAVVWQRGYYEHVIRDEEALHRIREYIINNPGRWELDRENANRKGQDDFYRWLESFKRRPEQGLKL